MTRKKIKFRISKMAKGGPLNDPEVHADQILSGYLNPVIHRNFRQTSKWRKQRHD